MKYTVFLIKDEYDTFEEIIENDRFIEKKEIDKSYGVTGTIYIGHNEDNEPEWYKELKKGLKDAPELLNKSTRSVMLVKRKSRIFAFTYGHGKSMLKSEAYERGFGMRVVLNNCEFSKLKSIDSSTIDAVTVQARTQTSKSSEIQIFQIDDTRDILKAITAEAIDIERYGKVIAGKDPFHFTSNFSFYKLNQLCDQLAEDYDSKEYKKHFEWIDYLNEVRDPELKEQLDTRLVNQINDNFFKKVHHDLHMAPPEIMDMEDGFEFE